MIFIYLSYVSYLEGRKQLGDSIDEKNTRHIDLAQDVTDKIM